MNLHRGIVTSYRHRDEYVVFFEPPYSARQSSAFLSQLLQLAWDVKADDLEIYNVQSAREVADEHKREGWDRPREVLLLEVGGSWAEVIYAEPSRTLFLCGPHSTEQLRRAQDTLDLCGWRKVPARLRMRCEPATSLEPAGE